MLLLVFHFCKRSHQRSISSSVPPNWGADCAKAKDLACFASTSFDSDISIGSLLQFGTIRIQRTPTIITFATAPDHVNFALDFLMATGVNICREQERRTRKYRRALMLLRFHHFTISPFHSLYLRLHLSRSPVQKP